MEEKGKYFIRVERNKNWVNHPLKSKTPPNLPDNVKALRDAKNYIRNCDIVTISSKEINDVKFYFGYSLKGIDKNTKKSIQTEITNYFDSIETKKYLNNIYFKAFDINNKRYAISTENKDGILKVRIDNLNSDTPKDLIISDHTFIKDKNKVINKIIEEEKKLKQ